MRNIYKSSLRKIKINYQEPINNHFEMTLPGNLKEMIMEICNEMHTKIQVVETIKQKQYAQKQYTERPKQATKEPIMLALNKRKLNN